MGFVRYTHDALLHAIIRAKNIGSEPSRAAPQTKGSASPRNGGVLQKPRSFPRAEKRARSLQIRALCTPLLLPPPFSKRGIERARLDCATSPFVLRAKIFSRSREEERACLFGNLRYTDHALQ